MGVLNFKEIPQAHTGPARDDFELFAREFLVLSKFRVLDGPDRGADGGRDMIVEETRSGPGGETKIRWLVSCKHKAHSGNSVTPTDETNVRDRIETHNCIGFIAFYSTVASSGLSQILTALRPKFELLTFDSAKIETALLAGPGARALAARYMPVSFNKWVHSSQYAVLPPAPDPQLIRNSFFTRDPHREVETAFAEARAREVPLFAVIYDEAHPSLSKLAFSLGYFMEYQTTKRLVDEHFVPLIGPSSDPLLAALVPEDNPLENCLWVVLDLEGKVIRREGVIANPDEGMRLVREVIKTVASPSSEATVQIDHKSDFKADLTEFMRIILGISISMIR